MQFTEEKNGAYKNALGESMISKTLHFRQHSTMRKYYCNKVLPSVSICAYVARQYAVPFVKSKNLKLYTQGTQQTKS